MKRLVSALVSGAMMTAVSVADGTSDPATRGAKEYFLRPGDVVLFLGNSITDQAGPEIDFLKADFSKQYPDLADGAGAVRFVKAGISGEQAVQGDARLPHLLKQHKPTVCVVGYGTCEVTFKNEASYTPAMKSILKQLKDAHVAATIVSAPPPSAANWKQPAQWPVSQFENGLPTMVKAAKQLAEEEGVPFVDSFAALTGVAKGSGKELSKDGIHLNADGYRAMTDALQAAWNFGKPLRKAEKAPALAK